MIRNTEANIREPDESSITADAILLPFDRGRRRAKRMHAPINPAVASNASLLRRSRNTIQARNTIMQPVPIGPQILPVIISRIFAPFILIEPPCIRVEPSDTPVINGLPGV